MALGSDLDDLERHIDWYGSVVARIPDVWGQARLTEHRQDFEKQMKEDLTGFELNLQGSLARSDQAFFAHATALAAAAQPKAKMFSSITSVKGEPPVLAPSSVDIETKTSVPTFNADGKQIATTDTTTKEKRTPVADVTPPTPDKVKAPDAEKAKDLISDFKDKDVITRTAVRLPDRVGFTTIGKGGITIEPTLRLAQKKRYLDFLNQLRRENEGDDIADSPGYSLNLVRIPVSLLPGKRTDVGHGAELTMTLTPILGDDLLPKTFSNLVANDLRHQLGLPLTQFLNDDKHAETYLKPEYRLGIQGLQHFNELIAAAKADKDGVAVTCKVRELFDLDKTYPGVIARLKGVRVFLDPDDAKLVEDLFEKEPTTGHLPPPQKIAGNNAGVKSAAMRFNENYYDKKGDVLRRGGLSAINLKLAVPALDFSPGLINKTGFPTSQLLEVYGLSNCFQIAFAAHNALHDAIVRQNYAHLPDVQGFLQQETIAAYRLLAEHNSQHLWTKYCNQHVVSAVRLRQTDELEKLREQFRADFRDLARGTTPAERAARPYLESPEYSTTAALAWCILVDSALLTDKLVRDMGETASAKRAPVPGNGAFLDYYHPHPSAEARQAFNCYAALRWPVRVFALDPVTQDQNIADSFSSRRETQLALAIAFTNGIINANTMTRYARRLELEAETVALNRTQVGFGHGENVFGWRFYPRYQTPETESNLTVLFRDQLVGGPSRNALLRDRRLEPGQRECVAIVMMPSFVPFVTLDTVGNWFGLANPKHKVLDHTQALKMSRTVQTLKTCGPNVTDAACYRPGEFERMLRRLEQLEARLPSQSVNFPVPVLNTLGGFEMFNNGTTDLAPELYGFYGAPGVKSGATTTLFLVGDHFSPLHSKVVVGNKPAEAKLLSRQVMQVEVAGDAVPLNGKHVTAHVATPYGVTRELLIPLATAAPAPPAPKEGYTLRTEAVSLKYCKAGVPNTGGQFNLRMLEQGGTKFQVAWDDNLHVAPKHINVVLTFEYNKCTLKVPVNSTELDKNNKPLPLKIPEADGVYTLSKEDLKRTVDYLATSLNAFGPFTAERNPFAGELAATVTLVPVDGERAFRTHTLETPVRFTFECSICPPEVPPPPIPPAEARRGGDGGGVPTPEPAPAPAQGRPGAPPILQSQ